MINRFCSSHDFDGAVVEFCRDTRFRLVLAPRDHAKTRDEHDGRIWVTHGWRVGSLASLVVRGIVLTVLFQSEGKLGFEGRGCFRLRIPVDVQRFDFGSEEVIGATGAKLCQTGSVLGIYETHDGCIVLDCSNETTFGTHLSAQPWQDGC